MPARMSGDSIRSPYRREGPDTTARCGSQRMIRAPIPTSLSTKNSRFSYIFSKIITVPRAWVAIASAIEVRSAGNAGHGPSSTLGMAAPRSSWTTSSWSRGTRRFDPSSSQRTPSREKPTSIGRRSSGITSSISSSPPVITARPMKLPTSVWSGPMVCSPPRSRSTPLISRRLEPTPVIRAPSAFRKRQRSCTWGSQAALPMIVSPSAMAAAMMVFSVAVTDASSRNISPPRSRPASSSSAPRSKLAVTPSVLKASRCVSRRRRPIPSPPGEGSTQRPVRASSGPASSTDPRIREQSTGSSVVRWTLRGSMRTVLGSTSVTSAPVEATSWSMVSTSRMWGTFRSRTGSSASSEAATIGSAPFLLPAGRIMPLNGCPPLMTKLSIPLPGIGTVARRITLPRGGGTGRLSGAARRLEPGNFLLEILPRMGSSQARMATFRLNPEMPPPAGDQPQAIDELVEGIEGGELALSLLGVTGSGKTRTMAGVMERLARPALVMAPNTTLAAQLTNEFKELFPDTAVEYFVSYYDYYQPEAYIPQSDTYIEKDSSMNEEIDRLRHSATSALLTRRDLIFVRGKFRVRGDTLEVFPAYEERAMRIELFGDQVERILVMDPVTGEIVGERDELLVFPASHYVAGSARMERAIAGIEAELAERLAELEREGKLLEAQRLRMRTTYDREMLREVGVCNGIENYSRHIDGRSAGTPPFTLLDYFPDDFVLFVDESHVTVPQIGGMYEGDRSRKVTLVEHGFRLPSALDNRPLRFDEFLDRIGQRVFVSATPGPYELRESTRGVQQIIRPTGLVDPEVVVRPTKGQVDDLIHEIKLRADKDQRILVTTLTKKMAEDLTDYLLEMGLRVRYLHSEIDTVQRIEILRDLRLGEFDALIGINLLREGLDLPEVTLVAILDADKEGFLRSETSLVQTIGRAARNVDGQVIMYADEVTPSMRRAIDETNRRRKLQVEYNQANGIDPQTVRKRVTDIIQALRGEEEGVAAGGRPRKGRAPRPARGRAGRRGGEPAVAGMPKDDLVRLITSLEEEMHEAADLRRELRVMTEVGVG